MAYTGLFSWFFKKSKKQKEKTRLKFLEEVDVELAKAYCSNNTALIPRAMSQEARQYTQLVMQNTFDRMNHYSTRYPEVKDMEREVTEAGDSTIVRTVSCKKYKVSKHMNMGYVNTFTEEFVISGDDKDSFNVDKITNIKN